MGNWSDIVAYTMEICNDQMKRKGKQMFDCKELVKNIVQKPKNWLLPKEWTTAHTPTVHCQGVWYMHCSQEEMASHLVIFNPGTAVNARPPLFESSTRGLPIHPHTHTYLAVHLLTTPCVHVLLWNESMHVYEYTLGIVAYCGKCLWSVKFTAAYM